MKVDTIVKQMIEKVTPEMHAHRRNSLLLVLNSLLTGSAATVTHLGRGLDSSAKEKHCIKRVDRLLSNRFLQRESSSIYQHLAQLAIGQNQRPIILIDWSDLDEYKRHFLIRATLSSYGRGVTLYEEVHDLSTKEKPATHCRFLSRLARILPQGCQPIIVTDAGFKTPWFKAVLKQGWDFLGRTRLPNFYSMDKAHWQCITQLYQRATSTPQAFSGLLARRNPLACQFVLYKQRRKGRKVFNRSGQPSRTKYAKVYSKSARDPWLLSTSLPITSALAKRAVKIYGLRMQIEEGFRDMKSRRYGQGFEYNKTTQIKRLGLLVMLTSIAHWLLMLFGLTAKIEDRHRAYQANTVKKQALSLPFVGMRLVCDKWFKPSIKSFKLAFKYLQRNSGVIPDEI